MESNDNIRTTWMKLGLKKDKLTTGDLASPQKQSIKIEMFENQIICPGQ